MCFCLHHFADYYILLLCDVHDSSWPLRRPPIISRNFIYVSCALCKWQAVRACANLFPPRISQNKTKRQKTSTEQSNSFRDHRIISYWVCANFTGHGVVQNWWYNGITSTFWRKTNDMLFLIIRRFSSVVFIYSYFHWNFWCVFVFFWKICDLQSALS